MAMATESMALLTVAAAAEPGPAAAG